MVQWPVLYVKYCDRMLHILCFVHLGNELCYKFGFFDGFIKVYTSFISFAEHWMQIHNFVVVSLPLPSLFFLLFSNSYFIISP
jgi:hypothetical protein